MPEKIDIPMGGLGGLLILGGAAALTYYLWPKGPSARAGGGAEGSAGSAPSGTSYTSPSAVEVTPSTENGSSSGWETSPQGQASGAGSGPTWYTPGGQTGPSWYNGLAGLGAAADPRPVQYMALADRVSYAQSKINDAYNGWHTGVYTWLVGGNENIAQMVASSNDTANAIIGALHELADNPEATYPDGRRKDRVIEEVAVRWSSSASGIIQDMRATSFLAEEWQFIKRFPQSLREVLSWTVGTVVGVAGEALSGAAWGVGKTALILGAAVAGVALLMRRAGVSIDAGPLKLK